MIDNTNYYFTDDEYDVFKEDRQTSALKPEMDMRRRIRQKLLDLNEEILPIIKEKGWNLHNHYKKSNVTSMIVPNELNKGRVNWLGVRYGKSKSELEQLNYGLPRYGDDRSGDILGFQKYTCMQINVSYTGFEAGIYFAVPHDSVDRNYLQDKIDDLKDQIVSELNNLKGYGFKWSVWNTNIDAQNSVPDFGYADPENTFDFDARDPEEFIDWWKKNDVDGCYSSMLMHFPRHDKRISEEAIVETIIDIFEKLYDFYNIISWHPKNI